MIVDQGSFSESRPHVENGADSYGAARVVVARILRKYTQATKLRGKVMYNIEAVKSAPSTLSSQRVGLRLSACA